MTVAPARSRLIDEAVAKALRRIFLDLSVGGHMPGWTVMSMHPDATVVHDLLDFPWPFADESVYYIRCLSVVQHVPHACAEHRIDPLAQLLDEMYRVLLPGGAAWITCPHASNSRQAWADPTNRRALTEDAFADRGFEMSHGFTLDGKGQVHEMQIELKKPERSM